CVPGKGVRPPRITGSDPFSRQAAATRGAIMRFWTRELAGWALVGLGLFVFWKCYVLLMEYYFLQGGSLTVIGLIIFRGGIHLLKVAVAARVCLEAREDRSTAAPGVPVRARPQIVTDPVTGVRR